MNYITITDKGNEILKATKEMFRDIDEKAFEGITDEDMEVMDRLLEKMTENLKAISPKRV